MGSNVSFFFRAILCEPGIMKFSGVVALALALASGADAFMAAPR